MLNTDSTSGEVSIIVIVWIRLFAFCKIPLPLYGLVYLFILKTVYQQAMTVYSGIRTLYWKLVMPERLVDTRVQKSANTVSFISFFGKVPDVYIQKK